MFNRTLRFAALCAGVISLPACDGLDNHGCPTEYHGGWRLWSLKLSQGHRRGEVAALVGRKPTWLSALLRRYRERGPDGLVDERHANAGRTPLLSSSQEALLEEALEQRCADGTSWSGPKVARWMSEQLGRRVHPQRGWETLGRHGYTGQHPRPQHREADAEAQEGFPSGLTQDR